MNEVFVGGIFGCIALIWSGLTAYLLGGTCPHRRKVGWYSMIGMEFAIASLFIAIIATGAYATLAEPEYPLDSIRGFVLFFFVACFLPVAIAAFKNSEKLIRPMQSHAVTQRMLHWIIALLMLLLILSGVYSGNQGKGDVTHIPLVVAHKSIGFVVVLLALWLVVRYFRTAKMDAPQLKRFQRITARVVTTLLAVLILAFPISGWLMSTFAGKNSYFFFLTIPPLFGPSEMGATIAFLAHRLIGPLILYVAIALHLAGALYHTYLMKDDIVRRMTG